MIPIIPYSHYYWVGDPPKISRNHIAKVAQENNAQATSFAHGYAAIVGGRTTKSGVRTR